MHISGLVRQFTKKGRRLGSVLPFLALLLPVTVGASMAPLSEDEMSAVDAQEGISIVLTTNSSTTAPSNPTLNTISAQRMRLCLDYAGANCTTYVGPGASSAFLDLETVSFTGVSADGLTTSLPASLTANLDVGSNASTGGSVSLNLGASWTRTRFRANALRHSQDATRSFGSIAFDTSGSVNLKGSVGLFDGAGSLAALRINVNDGEWYYRQNGNEFLWDNLNIDMGFTNGTLGINNTGIVLQAARFDFNMLWDMAYRSAPATAFTSSANVAPYLRYGWSGGVKNVQSTITSGGIGATEGLRLSWRADADTDFQWIIGDAGGSPAMLYFTDWRLMPGAPAAMSVPALTIDVINAGQGPGSFNYKGVSTATILGANEATPDAGALSVSLRDMTYLAYNSKVRLVDTSIGLDKTYDWALIYMLGDVDLNLFAYPDQKSGGSPREGIRFDLTLGVQSPGTWNQNSHFLIGDTDPGQDVAIGFLNTNFLISINNGFLTLLPGGMELETLTDFRWKLDVQFGGGFLVDLSNPVRMMDIDLDLHASRINALFIPPPCTPVCAKYIGFQWDARLNQTNAAVPSTADSYISLAEPSRPTVKFTFGQIGGDLQVRNGKIDIKSGGESTDLDPRLVFEQDFRFGLSATNAGFFTGGNRPVIANNVSIGTNKIGALAIPGGVWKQSFALKEQ